MTEERRQYACIMADPPWLERGSGKSKRGADRHYPLLTRQEIVQAIHGSPLWTPADDAHLWLWATSNHLEDALWVMDALGFRYVTQAVWVKLSKWTTDPKAMASKLGREVMAALGRGDIRRAVEIVIRTGLGQYLRGSHEILLLGTRGRGAQVRTDRRDLRSVIVAPIGRHSAKPEASYELIEARSKGPRLELFARTPREGWDAWGLEISDG